MNEFLEEYNQKIRLPHIREKITTTEAFLGFRELYPEGSREELQDKLSNLRKKESKLNKFPFKH